ncbi:hypothetical protein N7478_009163 [Penicillium angulare]|uniref:uncharacterized protein n=1 Tax=Penicillium angulare TaxID=116970 RepID=UPI002540FC7C|nr:uncharacterized protein N7478_009163 [Penicillium angulare]KAJ5274038.1 hypothetical protein N7478_009163 [Penicillium angulare]
MKFFTLHLVLLLGTFLGPVAAYDKRGTIENLDGKTSDTRSVAPGCAAKMIGEDQKDGKCDLKQFLKYIWYPRIGAGKFPKDPSDKNSEKVTKTVYGINGKDILDADGQPASLEVALSKRKDLDEFAPSLDKLSKQQINWENKGALIKLFGNLYKAGYTDGADSARLVRGATSYTEARSQVTKFLPHIASKYPMVEKLSSKPKDYRNGAKLVEAAQNCVESAYKTRLWDYETFRIGQNGLKKRLDTKHPELNVQIKTKKINTGLGFPDFNALDADATLSANPDLTKDQLVTACKEQRTRGGTDKEHWTALQAAVGSVYNGQCERVNVKL